MKKLFLTVILALLLVSAFAICAFATEYTVSSSDEFKSAFSEAQDGDTIVIKASISATHDFGKSITYILDGDGIVWSAGSQNTNAGKEVTILSRGGTNYFKPNSSMWCNSYGLTVRDLSTTNWTLGAYDNESKLVFDLTSVTGRLFYGTFLNEINFKSGLDVTNLNSKETSGDSNFFKCKTINMYDGVRVYGNYLSKPLFDVTNLNMYGGEIKGNVCTGMWPGITVKNLKMYGGVVSGNYQPAPHGTYTNANDPQCVAFITADESAYLYAGAIEKNFVGLGHDKVNATVSGLACRYNNKAMYIGNGVKIDENVLVVHGTFGAYTRDENGYYTSQIDTENYRYVTDNGDGTFTYDRQIPSSRFKITNYQYSLIFKNEDGSLINAYMINEDGTVLKSFDGSDAVSLPNADAWSTKAYYCGQITPDLTKQGTYYVASAHKIIDDYNCQTALECQVCQEIFQEALSHSLVESWAYANGYSKNGLYTAECKNDGCSFRESTELDALFVNKGYTVDSVNGTGFAYVVCVNKEAIDLYNEKTGADVKYGFIVGKASGTSGDIISNDGKEKLDGAIVTDFTDLAYNDYKIYTLKLTDIKTPEQMATEIYACAYVIDGARISYLGKDETDLAISVSLNTLKND